MLYSELYLQAVICDIFWAVLWAILCSILWGILWAVWWATLCDIFWSILLAILCAILWAIFRSYNLWYILSCIVSYFFSYILSYRLWCNRAQIMSYILNCILGYIMSDFVYRWEENCGWVVVSSTSYSEYPVFKPIHNSTFLTGVQWFYWGPPGGTDSVHKLSHDILITDWLPYHSTL